MTDRTAEQPGGAAFPHPTYTLFLCGPITGLAPDRAASWRQYVIDQLPSYIVPFDPTRENASYGVSSASPATRTLTSERLRHGKGVVTRDRFEAQRCYVLLANFLGAKTASIGSVGEIFWADAARKPIIIVREKDTDNPHNHDMLNEIAGWIFYNLDDGIAQAKRLCSPNYARME
jgi:hypothetical protein